ncbi:hypothetical protein ACWF94_06160 [Streptomyces sp. NPDC055078]
MPLYAGQILTAGQAERIQPRTYEAAGNVQTTGPVSNFDVPGAVINLTTLAPNATYVAECVWDFDQVGTGTNALGSGRLKVDGVLADRFATFQTNGSVNDRKTTSQNYRGILAAAGAHTLGLTVNLPNNQMILQGVYSSLIVTIYEVV